MFSGNHKIKVLVRPLLREPESRAGIPLVPTPRVSTQQDPAWAAAGDHLANDKRSQRPQQL